MVLNRRDEVDAVGSRPGLLLLRHRLACGVHCERGSNGRDVCLLQISQREAAAVPLRTTCPGQAVERLETVPFRERHRQNGCITGTRVDDLSTKCQALSRSTEIRAHKTYALTAVLHPRGQSQSVSLRSKGYWQAENPRGNLAGSKGRQQGQHVRGRVRDWGHVDALRVSALSRHEHVYLETRPYAWQCHTLQFVVRCSHVAACDDLFPHLASAPT